MTENDRDVIRDMTSQIAQLTAQVAAMKETLDEIKAEHQHDRDLMRRDMDNAMRSINSLTTEMRLHKEVSDARADMAAPSQARLSNMAYSIAEKVIIIVLSALAFTVLLHIPIIRHEIK